MSEDVINLVVNAFEYKLADGTREKNGNSETSAGATWSFPTHVAAGCKSGSRFCVQVCPSSMFDRLMF